MLDLFLLAFVLGFLALGLRRPFLWVLAYIYIDVVAPQKIGWGVIQSIPVSLIAFGAAVAGWFLVDSKEGTRFSFRQGLMLALLGWCALTLSWAEFPEEAADKWDWVWKALVFAIFLPLTLRTRLRIEGAVLVLVLSAAAITINGGLKTVFGGGGYGTLSLYVDDNVGLYESSIISAVAITVIPLVLWLVKHGTIFRDSWYVRLFAAGVIFSCLLMPIGTQARTGLICIAALAALLLRSVKHRFLYMAAAAVLGLAAIPFLPQSFTERMETIQDHESDESASTRVAVWKWTLDYVGEHPLGGGFDSYRGNSFTYQAPEKTKTGNTTIVKYDQITDKARAFHSSYFELLGEQGWPGLAIWLALMLTGLWQMEIIRRKFVAREGPDEQWQGALALALQQAHIVFLVGAAFVGIGYQPFIYMLVGVQCALWGYVKHTDGRAREKIVIKRPAADGSRG